MQNPSCPAKRVSDANKRQRKNPSPDLPARSAIASLDASIPAIRAVPPDCRNGLLARELENVLRRRALTEADAIDAARCLYADESRAAVARAFGVRPVTLIGILRRHGLTPPPASRRRSE